MASTRRTAAAIATNIGKKVVYPIKATLEASPRPNHTRNMGRKASGGMGRTNSITGSRKSRSGTQIPARMPSPMAASAASPYPSATRPREVRRCRCS